MKYSVKSTLIPNVSQAFITSCTTATLLFSPHTRRARAPSFEWAGVCCSVTANHAERQSTIFLKTHRKWRTSLLGLKLFHLQHRSAASGRCFHCNSTYQETCGSHSLEAHCSGSEVKARA
jgi:hypothetical protein